MIWYSSFDNFGDRILSPTNVVIITTAVVFGSMAIRCNSSQRFLPWKAPPIDTPIQPGVSAKALETWWQKVSENAVFVRNFDIFALKSDEK
jgi:hypothetical protein